MIFRDFRHAMEIFHEKLGGNMSPLVQGEDEIRFQTLNSNHYRADYYVYRDMTDGDMSDTYGVTK